MTADPSNGGSNKGIVNLRYEPYADPLAAMKSLNIFALAECAKEIPRLAHN
jgi:hypothetical protein